MFEFLKHVLPTRDSEGAQKKPERGLFVTFEGIDPVVRGEAMQELANGIARAGGRVHVLAPVTLPLHLRAPAHDPGRTADAMRHFAACRDQMAKIVVPKLLEGVTVLTQRFVDDAFGRFGPEQAELSLELLLLERVTLGGTVATALGEPASQPLRPDHTFWIHAMPEAVAARYPDGSAQQHEEIVGQPLAHLQRMHAALDRRRTADQARFCVINSAQPAIDLHASVHSAAAGRGILGANHVQMLTEEEMAYAPTERAGLTPH